MKSKRIDSEYFKKEYIELVRKIQLKKRDFEKFEDINLKVDASAFYPSLEPYYGTGNFPFLRVADVDTNIDYEKCVRIPLEIIRQSNFNTLNIIKKGDIIITKGGSIARVGLIEQDTAVTRDLIFINSSILTEINYKFLFLYLLSNVSYRLLIRSSSMTAQPHLTIKLVRDLPIFKASNGFKVSATIIFDKSKEVLIKSKECYNEAGKILFEQIGLQNFEPSKEPVNVKSFKESFGATGRLDAEYYQPKYDDLEKIIISQPHMKIKDIRQDNFRGLQPIYVENGNLDIINSKHILENALDYDNFEKTSIEYWSTQERARVFRGDILTYTTGANIGRTQVYLKDKRALASNHVNIIRLKEGNSIYIGFVLNSIIGRLQTEKRSAGSAQAELYPKDLDEFLVPIIDIKKQEQIAELVEVSSRLKAESERLLEVAKKAVEMAIEVDEVTAMKYIESQDSI